MLELSDWRMSAECAPLPLDGELTMAREALRRDDLLQNDFDQLSSLSKVIGGPRVFGSAGIFAPTPELVAAAEVALAVDIAIKIIGAFKGGSDDALEQINAKLDMILHNQKIIIEKLDELSKKVEQILVLMKDIPYDVKELDYFIAIQALSKQVEGVAKNVHNSETPEAKSVNYLIERFDAHCAESEVFIQQYSQSIPQIHAAFSLYSSLRLFYAASQKHKGPKIFPGKIWFRDRFKQMSEIFSLVLKSTATANMKHHFMTVLNQRRKDVEINQSSVPDIARLMELYGPAFNVNIPDGKYLYVHNVALIPYWESCGGENPFPRTSIQRNAEEGDPSRSTFDSCHPGWANQEEHFYFMFGIVKYDLGPFITDEYRFLPVTHSKDHLDSPLAGTTYIEFDFEPPQSAPTAVTPKPFWPLYQKSVMKMRLYVVWLRATEFLKNQALQYTTKLST